MPLHGQIKRSKPRIRVLRGYNPNEPHTLTQTHPVKDAVTVLSGQIISLAWNSSTSKYEWVLGMGSGDTPYIALQDWDKSQTAGLGQFGYDPDVQEAGKLTGLSCAGEFEVQTAYFYRSDTYPMDAKLTAVNTTGTGNGDAGDLRVAIAGEAVVGFITRPTSENKPNSLKRINSNVEYDANDKDVITWTTRFTYPNPA